MIFIAIPDYDKSRKRPLNFTERNFSHNPYRIDVDANDKGFQVRLDVDFNNDLGSSSSFQRWQVRDNQGSPVISSMKVVRW